MDYHKLLIDRLSLKPKNFQMCVRCVMDTSDPRITFDQNGICNHCLTFTNYQKHSWMPNEKGGEILKSIANKIKRENTKQQYSCVLGVSGGIDSSFLLYYVVKNLGLKPLALHVDCGWNSEIAVKNIESLLKILNIDLCTEVIDWEEMKDLQLAFLKSGVANQDTPQDHAIFAALYKFAIKNNVKYVITGSNLATESILPLSWGYDAMDGRHLKAIQKLFGTTAIKNFPTVSYLDLYFYFPYIKKMQVIKPFNYMPYSKEDAMQILKDKLGWRYYGGKHCESRFTKFFQNFYLPARFGYDKRRAHLSSLIVANQLTKEAALVELKKDIYPPDELESDRVYVLKKLGLNEASFQNLLHAPLVNFNAYPSYQSTLWFKLLKILWDINKSLKNKTTLSKTPFFSS